MSDLISRSALLEKLNNYHYDTVNAQTRRIEHIVNAHFIELIEKQPTAFDVDKVIKELEIEKYNFSGSVIQTYSFSSGIESGIVRAIDIIKKHLSGTAESSKMD